MEYKKIKKLINNVIGNEFSKIQLYEENNFVDNDVEQIKLNKESDKLFKQLEEKIPSEYLYLLHEYEAAIIAQWSNISKFYFKQGVKSGLIDLNFLNDIKHLSCMIESRKIK